MADINEDEASLPLLLKQTEANSKSFKKAKPIHSMETLATSQNLIGNTCVLGWQSDMHLSILRIKLNNLPHKMW